MDQPVAPQPASSVHVSGVQDEVLARVGHMTRMLHDNLRGLGFDKLLAKAAHDIPDARDRLDYVARMTEQAAQRVLTATELASPLQDRIEEGAADLRSAWQVQLANAEGEQTRALAERTLAYLQNTQGDASVTKQQLMDIMMAQDFQDLTGQVIRRVTELAHGIEQQLLQLLIDYAPPEIKRDAAPGLLNGPQIHPTGNADVVANQGQVDDLLESLGF